jgi:UDP-N-acetyl-D-mannosaminuronic acid dehydrogenase
MNPSVCVIGLGYIGLPTAAVIASAGFRVNGFDIHEGVVETINRGKCHFIEKDLDHIVKNAVEKGKLVATQKIVPSDIYMICVPTPITQSNEPDVSYVISAAHEIASVLKPGDLVILESTCPVGTTRHIETIFLAACEQLKFPTDYPTDSDIAIGYCPERVLPGKIISELVNNSRIVGGLSPRCAIKIQSFFNKFINGSINLVSSPETAEMVKLAENSYRDVNIAFANELSMIAENVGVNVWEVIDNANVHPRVNILEPGAGVGGHCIAVDPWFLHHSSPDNSKIIKTAREVNISKTDWALAKINKKVQEIKALKGLDRVAVAVYGLTFKPDVDDLRESPALTIAQTLSQSTDIALTAIDPFVSELQRSNTNLSFSDLETKCSYDLEVILVSHSIFKDKLVGDQYLSFTRHIE